MSHRTRKKRGLLVSSSSANKKKLAFGGIRTLLVTKHELLAINHVGEQKLSISGTAIVHSIIIIFLQDA